MGRILILLMHYWNTPAGTYIRSGRTITNVGEQGQFSGTIISSSTEESTKAVDNGSEDNIQVRSGSEWIGRMELCTLPTGYAALACDWGEEADVA